MKCKHCGKTIDDDSVYCIYCGKKVVIALNGNLQNPSIEPTEVKEQTTIEKQKTTPTCNRPNSLKSTNTTEHNNGSVPRSITKKEKKTNGNNVVIYMIIAIIAALIISIAWYVITNINSSKEPKIPSYDNYAPRMIQSNNNGGNKSIDKEEVTHQEQAQILNNNTEFEYDWKDVKEPYSSDAESVFDLKVTTNDEIKHVQMLTVRRFGVNDDGTISQDRLEQSITYYFDKENNLKLYPNTDIVEIKRDDYDRLYELHFDLEVGLMNMIHFYFDDKNRPYKVEYAETEVQTICEANYNENNEIVSFDCQSQGRLSEAYWEGRPKIHILKSDENGNWVARQLTYSSDWRMVETRQIVFYEDSLPEEVDI